MTRKRSKYRPRPVLKDTMTHVKLGISSVASHDSFLVDLKIRNSGAMVALMQGKAVKEDMNALMAMSNVTEALCRLGFGKDYSPVSAAGHDAIEAIIWRAVRVLKFVPKGQEIKALNELMELHDAQMDVITISDIERALDLAKTLSRTAPVSKMPVPEWAR